MRIVRSGFAVISLLASGAAYAGTQGWSLSEASGQVSIVSTGIVKAAVRGGGVATGDIVSTGRTGRAVLVRGEEYLVVAPNSRIRVADPAKSGGLTQIVEQFGNVIFKIKKMTMPHFAVETPFLAAVVKGTTFSVTVTEKGASVQVIEGRVEVGTRDGGATYLVLPGDIGSVSATTPGRLNVQGRAPQRIDSPTPAAAAAAVTASLADSSVQVAEADAVHFDGAIATPVSEGSVRLSALSDGMVQGDSALLAAISTVTASSRNAPRPVAAEVSAAANPIIAADPVANVPTPPTVVVVAAAPVAAAPVVVAAAPVAPAPVVVAAAPVVPAPVVVAAAPVAPAPVVVAAAPAAPAPAVVVAAAPMVPAPVVVVAAAPQPSIIQTIVTIASTIVANAGNSGSNNSGNNGNGNNGNNGRGNANGTGNGMNGNGNAFGHGKSKD